MDLGPTERFFPNQSRDVMGLERRFRAEAAKLPQPSRLVLYELLSNCLPSLTPTVFELEGDQVIARQNGREIAFPSPIPMVKLSHAIFGYEEWLERKYCLPGFVEVERGDVVVDCGAYVGGFSMRAAAKARQVHAFEPSAGNFACLTRNFRTVGNVVAMHAGLYSRTQPMRLNLSENSVEHSLLEPDDGAAVGEEDISAIRLDDYCRTAGVDRLDFVKIEAEGVELEVFEGLGEMRPRKLAIDVSPERNGESPAEAFHAQLSALGYALNQRGHVLFAKLPS